jgi:hypothetical protein
MLHVTMMRGALSSLSALFGGFGVFFLYHSFGDQDLGAYALMFLGTATAMVFSTRQRRQ